MSLDTSQAEHQMPLTGFDDLEAFFQQAQRASEPLLIGLEHEKLLFPRSGPGPVAYDGPNGIEAVLRALSANGFAALREAPNLPTIALSRGREIVSLEPGGQLELSGSPFPTARQAHEENLAHLSELRPVLEALGLRAVALGFRPFGRLDDMPWMPKTRYRVMRETLGARGSMAHHMMLMTATGQVSFDFRSEADCARKVTAAARAAPVLVALFANSPIAEGRPTGFMSWRSRVWTDVDPARCGFPDCLIDGAFSYRRYLEWVADAPMLFLRRNGRYIDPQLTFRQLLERGWEGERATTGDWVDHLSTMFPEVRIKKVIEIRSADAVDARMTGGLAALLRGLLYDETALDEVTQLLPAVAREVHVQSHVGAQKLGLEAPWKRGTLADLAGELLGISEGGLTRLDPLDVPLLEPLKEVVAARRSPAAHVLESFERQSPEGFLKTFELAGRESFRNRP